ncbi:tripartite tricarboxylate transporter TctB family protein [Neomegalonema sp.]|uniref:tripartite tricarboxylate transporter TctB family protein n=1 Tax=Neomegalonema sp. TaxID=2039713 RepID=UPI002633FA6E|nr:tripartite tricarboxylate transporter TctB family protein [Neomegalonema sp.]MDD2867015.1 tripartite tricarboxylate transporter TctB family protein [Neomegalonema sp.]
MKSLKFDLTDLLAGLMFVAFGLIFGLTSWFDLDLGTARRMGPGYFPLLLSGVLLLLGLIIILASTRRQGEPVGALA